MWTCTGRAGEQRGVGQTQVKTEGREVVTRAAEAGEVLRVGEADLQRQLALGRVDHGGVLEADLHLQVVLGLVVQAIVGVEAPGPAGRVLDGLQGQQALEDGPLGRGQRAALHHQQAADLRHGVIQTPVTHLLNILK